MITLSELKDLNKKPKRYKRVGRGIGTGKGKTCGRGHKGAGSRSGYRRRWGYEGGQIRLHMKLPKRGFSNVRFKKEVESVNLYEIEQVYSDGENVNLETLKNKGLVSSNAKRVKLLGDGELTRKVSVELQAISSSAQEKLQSANISFTIKD